jgi:prophage antirepressor-like protein
MTTELLDNTISELLQNNPAVEYVNPQENPLSTIPNDGASGRKSTDIPALRLFENTDFKVRVIIRDGEPWFVAKDVCDCLTITDASQACKNLDDDEKQVVTRDFDSLLFTESKSQALTLISESGLYTLVMRSNKPNAKVFRKWVTAEVLPSIRKTGSYSVTGTQTPMMCLPQDYESALEALLAKVRENKALQAERDEALHAESLAKEASDQSFKARATAMGRLSNIADREYLAHMTETVCKKQLGILRDGRYKAEALLGTQWMRSCFKNEAYKSMRRWITSMASRRVTARLVSELSMKTGDASDLRELYVEAKLYGVDFDTLAEERGFTDVRKAQKVLSSCVAVVDRYECNRGDGELKLCPICGYSPEIWGETLHVLANSPQVLKWLRDNTTVDELEWWIAEKANENYGLPRV